MAVKWFDLSERGGKLERPQDEAGVYHLRLTLERPVAAAALEPAAAQGWVGSEAEPGRLFTNYRRFEKLSEIVTALGPFFPEEAVAASKVDVRKLRRDEVVEGFDDQAFGAGTGMLPGLDRVGADLASMPAAMRDRILARVAAAQQLSGVGPGADGSALLRQDGVRLWRDLSVRFGVRDATVALASTVLLAQERGESFEAAHRALFAAAETGSGLPMVEGRARQRAEAMANRFARAYEAFGGLDPSWTEERFFREVMIEVPGLYRMWDGARFDFARELDAPEAFGNRFLADPSIPGSWRHDAYYRVSASLRGAASMLGVEPRELFNGQVQLFHLGKGTGDTGLAYHRTSTFVVGGEQVGVAAIKFSPFHSGAVVHEVGHGVDVSHRAALASNAMEHLATMDRLIGVTGVGEHVSAMVERATWLSAECRAYLLTPEEIVARSFEAALADRSIAAGDPDFEVVGGAAMLNGSVNFGPTPELGWRFVSALREVVREAKERRLDADQDADAEPAASGHGP